MKINYLSSTTIPSRSANSIHIMKMCQAFATNGHDVTLFAHLNKEDKDVDVFNYYGVNPNFRIKPLINTTIPYFGHLNGLIMALRAKINKTDMVIGRHPTGCYFSSLFGLPTFFETHAPVIDSGKLTNFLFKLMIKKKSLKQIILITNTLKDYFCSTYPEIKNKITILPDSADEIDLNNVTSAKIRIRDKLNVGYTGHLYKGKGMELISKLLPVCQFAHFHIVGGKEEDIKFWKNKLSQSKNISFYGYHPHSDIPKFLKDFDVVLLPNQKAVKGNLGNNIGDWTSPLKLFEYMAAGKPIICSDIPVLREVAENEKNALLCAPDDIGAWKYNLERLRDNSNLRHQIGKTAYENFLANYTWEVRAKHLLENFEQQNKKYE